MIRGLAYYTLFLLWINNSFFTLKKQEKSIFTEKKKEEKSFLPCLQWTIQMGAYSTEGKKMRQFHLNFFQI